MDDDDEIARVARLRGRDPKNYTREKIGPIQLFQKFGPQRVHSLFFPVVPDKTTHMEVFDALPIASRRFIDTAPLAMCPIKYSEMLEECGDQAVLLAMLSDVMPLQLKGMVARKWGPKHPQAEDTFMSAAW